MAAPKQPLDQSTLKAFSNAAAGHDGVMSDPSGELLIKPCTAQEIEFYQRTGADHPDFAELMPTFMGTLSLGAPGSAPDVTAASESNKLTQAQKDQQLKHGVKIASDTAIVLENLEYGFKQPNVLDLKLGARLYADGTSADKAERLDKVSAETTSGSLNFRIAGMKVWNGQSFDIYDKFYGRKFSASNVSDGFATFFAPLSTGGVPPEQAQELLETIEAEIAKARHLLERAESRMYSASVLIVYEGDNEALGQIMSGHEPKTRADERAPTMREVKQSVEEEEEEEEGDAPRPVAFKVKMIDFAHAEWCPGKGKDENVVKGLKNVEAQMDGLISRFD